MYLVLKPGAAIILGAIIIILLGLIFMPAKGLLSRWANARKNTQRVFMEDTLKFIFDCEYKNLPCGLHGIAGNLGISSNHAANILEHLQSIGLTRMNKGKLGLTDAGKSYALKIIRIHRVWERYLAEETGVNQMDWHGAADTKEHIMSLDEADQLAAQLGNPAFDPHGDPIPSSAGELPTHRGVSLSSLQEGDIGIITHIEDEPALVYSQIVALDLYPGTKVYVMDVKDEKIQFTANGEVCVLSPLFADNVTVEILLDKEPVEKKYPVLANLQIGEQAEIVNISSQCRGQERRRLMDLGVIPGTIIRSELKNTFGDPTAYRVMGTTIAIRNNLADKIFIKKLNGNNEP